MKINKHIFIAVPDNIVIHEINILLICYNCNYLNSVWFDRTDRPEMPKYFYA